MTDRILLSIDAGMAEVRLDRPEKMNIIDPAMLEALVTAGKRLMNEADLRAAVLSGEERALCVGLDMGSTASLGGNDAGLGVSAGRLVKRTYRAANPPRHACTIWRDLPVLVLAAVHSVAYGGGLQIALGTDVRYVAADMCLSVMEIKWGLVPDMGGIALTRGLVRPDQLRKLIYSGRVANGEEVFALGLVTYVVDDPRVVVLAVARDTVPKSSDAIHAGKRLMRVMEDGDTTAILPVESVGQDRLIGADNQHEVVLAGIQSRAPVSQPTAKSEQKLEIVWGW